MDLAENDENGNENERGNENEKRKWSSSVLYAHAHDIVIGRPIEVCERDYSGAASWGMAASFAHGSLLLTNHVVPQCQ